VYLDKALFDAGALPAIDVTRSVSRIGGNAQDPRIKQEAGRTKLDYLQFLELEVFVRFGTRLEPAMERRIRRGRALRELLKQDRLAPLPIEFEMAWLSAFNDGVLEDVDLDLVRKKLRAIGEGLAREPLTLQEERPAWAAAVKSWLQGVSA
jgi:F-type H+-transporting ATPase subunit alpha